ncbi:phosphatidylinositol 4-phosphate 3-kinase C2 domain-containing subunit beta isoform X2 [Chironomus tepperi]|uniref:phosphatidylinositol 4-phosphate 3-kinase C2 domain-containing subunit beta isoform X2 n=1 Tax=Chironomus tepperi TaxID=113505 RepID=UPI00391F9976
MSRMSEEEIAKAISLEEAALDEFKLRKGSLPNQPNYSKTSINDNKLRNSLHSSSSSSSLSNIERKIDELDLISFANDDQTKVVKKKEDDPYNKLIGPILELNSNRNQIVPYTIANQQASSQSFPSLYSLSNTANNQYYSQQMYFNPSSYQQRLGFERFSPQPHYSPYNNTAYSGINQQQSYGLYAHSPNQYGWVRPQINAPVPSTSTALPPPTTIQQSFHTVKSENSLIRVSDPAKTSTTQNLGTQSIAGSSQSLNSSQISQNVALKRTSKNENLINLDDADDSMFNILDAFDPLSSKNEEASNAYYTDQDPFDYIYNGGTQYSDPLYEAVVRSDRSVTSPKNQSTQDISSEYYSTGSIKEDKYTQDEPPPLPPRNSSHSNNQHETINSQQFYTNNQYSKKLYENIVERRKYDKDSMAFYKMVKDLRSKYNYNDSASNVGHVVAAALDSKYLNVSIIKILVYPSFECFNLPNNYLQNYKIKSNTENYQKLDTYLDPVAFTCDIDSTISHVIMQVLTNLENELSGSAESYALKTIGSQEWLSPFSCLSQLEYIHNSIKLEKDVQLGLFPKKDEYMKVIARTHQDDCRDAQLKIENILPKDPVTSISYESLIILLETLEMEIDKLESASTSQIYSSFNASGVIQAVKAICALLGAIDTFELYSAINKLKNTCDEQLRNMHQQPSFTRTTFQVDSEKGNYSHVTLKPRSISEEIKRLCDDIRDSVQHLLEVYSQAFQVNFSVNRPQWESPIKSIANVSQNVMLNVMALHRPPTHWKYDEYKLASQIYHGTRGVSEPRITPCSNSLCGFFPRLTFDSWLIFDDVPVCSLPRESRIVFVLYGCLKQPVDGQATNDTSQNNHQEGEMLQEELGWTSIQFFDYEKQMIQGTYFLSFWPPTNEKYLCPSPQRGTHPQGDYCPILSIEIPIFDGCLVFPDIVINANLPKLDYECLDRNLQDELVDTVNQGVLFNQIDKREVLWEKRHYLHKFPKALPKILNTAHSWDYASLSDLHALVKEWSPLTPLEAIELLLPKFPDLFVREQAVKWISKMDEDELVDFLPQLLQALKFDCYESSPLACFLLGRSLDSPRVAHFLYWLLIQNLPGDCPQNTMETTQIYEDNYVLLQCRFHRRNQMMLRALLAICGENLCSRFLSQNILCKSLDDVAKSVKTAKESLRLPILRQTIENVHQILSENPTSLPLSPGLEVKGVVAKTCSYFNSNTLPLKINFMGPDELIIPAIFKCGDDLQQDMLTLQIVRIIDKMWLKEGLDLKMVSFQCVPTGFKKGMIEMITNAETLREIQVKCGLTGSFKDKPIAEWLQKQNPNQLEYQRAVDNFTSSCAGYSIITYILGICDRHNDNIMLKTSGHIFHIDFGKFLGDAQMFGNFKRDRTPFVLTSDMAYVINGGDKPSSKFHNFVDLCCKAFNIVRKHGDLLLHIFAFMASSGIPGVTSDAVNYVRNALMPGASNPEAASNFAKMIHVSLKSWFTQFNFFLHNLAQMRFTNQGEGSEVLSFVPKTYKGSRKPPFCKIA